MKKYSMGIDYGTLSARAILVDLDTGKCVGNSEFAYPHAVMTENLPDGTTLEENMALQHPQDYLDATQYMIHDLLERFSLNSNSIVGIGIDFTSCTMLAVDKNGTPLCFYDEYISNPHAYAKSWKHHSPQKQADKITAIAQNRKEAWLEKYGGKVSCEWLLPKILETLEEAPEVFDKTARFIEAGEWLTWLLTGKEVHSSCMAGFKAMWNRKDGYPHDEFFKEMHPQLCGIVGTKISANVLPAGTKAGTISEYGSQFSGLSQGTAVAVPLIDAHTTLPAAGITEEGKLMMIIGTSTCHIVLSKEAQNMKGICGYVEDGIIPGYIAYEAGQSCVGDSFDWFINNCVPASYAEHAKEEGVNLYDYIQKLAENLEVGESGLVALDWWNGNRTPLADFDLKGTIYGLTLQTKPEEIYRAIIESTAFGSKLIVDLYENNGIAINEVYASGGIPQKNSLLMQIYADVLNKEITVPLIQQVGATGSAIFGAYAGGYFDTIEDAAKRIANHEKTVYTPNREKVEKYQKLYSIYKDLFEFFSKYKP